MPDTLLLMNLQVLWKNVGIWQQRQETYVKDRDLQNFVRICFLMLATMTITTNTELYQ